jgi:hypothetical protein
MLRPEKRPRPRPGGEQLAVTSDVGDSHPRPEGDRVAECAGISSEVKRTREAS